MIYMVTGKIGGGKSLLVLTKALHHLGQGGCVVSNIAMDLREIDGHLWRKYRRRLVKGQVRFHNFEEEPEFQGHIPWGVPDLPVMVICDEAQLYYNQAESSRLVGRLMRLLSFLTQSRKCSVDVWFVTQHDTTVWAQFRHQCLFGYKCRDMRAVSLPFIGQLPMLGLSWVKYDIMSGEIMERGTTKLDKSVFRCYDTRQMYDAQMRDLQQAAEIWQPVTKKERGMFEDEVDSDSRAVSWWHRLLGLQSLRVLREQEEGGDGSV